MKLLIVSAILLVTLVSVQSRIPGIIPGCTGCSVDGVCYFPNQEWKQGCWTKKCVVYQNGVMNGWKTLIVKTQCPDTYGRCVDHGQKLSNGCYCKTNGYQWNTICGGK